MQESKIFWENAKHLGVDLTQYYLLFGREVAKKIAKKNKTYSIVCGLDGNGSDGLAIAGLLIEEDIRRVNVYVVGRVKNSDHPIFKFLYDSLSQIEDDKLVLKQDCFAEDIEQADFTIECLAGTGLTGNKLNKRYHDVVKRFAHFYSKKIAIDSPVFHYTPDETYSLIYPKVENAEVVNIKIPENIEQFCGPAELNFLNRPNTKSHKSKNGKLLVLDLGNSIDSKLLAMLRSDFPVDVAVFAMNRKPLRKSAIEYIMSEDLEQILNSCDSILIESIDKDYLSLALLERILEDYPDKKYIIGGEMYGNLNDKLSSIRDIAIVFSKHSHKYSNRRFIHENNLNALFYGVSTILYNPAGEMRKVVGLNKNTKEILYNTSLYSTQNDLWLSLRASLG